MPIYLKISFQSFSTLTLLGNRLTLWSFLKRSFQYLSMRMYNGRNDKDQFVDVSVVYATCRLPSDFLEETIVHATLLPSPPSVGVSGLGSALNSIIIYFIFHSFNLC
jgi:hypothetical protein